MKPIGLAAAMAASVLAVSPVLAQQDASGGQNPQTQQNQQPPSQAQASPEGAQQQTGQQQAQAQGGDAAQPGNIHPLTITCRDIVQTDVKLVPQLVYWIDGYNVAYEARQGEVVDVDPVVRVGRNWLTVPANDVIRACEATPQALAADVIEEQKAAASQ